MPRSTNTINKSSELGKPEQEEEELSDSEDIEQMTAEKMQQISGRGDRCKKMEHIKMNFDIVFEPSVSIVDNQDQSSVFGPSFAD